MRKSIVVSLLIISSLFAGEKYTLEECLDIAQKNNPDMMMSNQQLEISRNQLSQAQGNFFPSLNAYVRTQRRSQGDSEYLYQGAKVTQEGATSNYYEAGLSLNQPLFNSDMLSGYKLAKNGVTQAGVSKNQTRQYLIYDVTEKFYTYLKAQELLNVYEKAHKNSLEQLKKTEEMQRLGQVAKKDVLKAKVKEGSDRLNIINQQKALETSAINLQAAMGIDPNDENFVVYEKIYEPVKGVTLTAAKEYSFENNNDLKLLEEQKKSAELQYQMAKSAYLPTLSASFGYSRGGNQFDRIYSETDKWWNSSLTLSLGFSLFEGFKRKNEVQIKQIESNIYDERIRKQKIQMTSNLDDLVRTLNTYKEMLEINQINLNSAKEDL